MEVEGSTKDLSLPLELNGLGTWEEFLDFTVIAIDARKPQLMTNTDFITHLFCRVDDKLTQLAKTPTHVHANLHRCAFGFLLPQGRRGYGDKSYNNYEMEDMVKFCA